MTGEPALLTERVSDVSNPDVVRVREQWPEKDAGKSCDGAMEPSGIQPKNHTGYNEHNTHLLFSATHTRAAVLGDQRAEPPAWWRAAWPAVVGAQATTRAAPPHHGPQDGAGVGGTEMAQVLFNPRRERATQRSGVARALETKFLLFWVGQERDSVLSRSP